MLHSFTYIRQWLGRDHWAIASFSSVFEVKISLIEPVSKNICLIKQIFSLLSAENVFQLAEVLYVEFNNNNNIILISYTELLKSHDNLRIAVLIPKK